MRERDVKKGHRVWIVGVEDNPQVRPDLRKARDQITPGQEGTIHSGLPLSDRTPNKKWFGCRGAYYVAMDRGGYTIPFWPCEMERIIYEDDGVMYYAGHERIEGWG